MLILPFFLCLDFNLWYFCVLRGQAIVSHNLCVGGAQSRGCPPRPTSLCLFTTSLDLALFDCSYSGYRTSSLIVIASSSMTKERSNVRMSEKASILAEDSSATFTPDNGTQWWNTLYKAPYNGCHVLARTIAKGVAFCKERSTLHQRGFDSQTHAAADNLSAGGGDMVVLPDAIR